MDLKEILSRQKVVPIIRASDPDVTFPIVQALHNGGIDLVEVTLTIPDALSAIQRIRHELPSVVVGAGTVRDRQDGENAVAMGAQFLVTYKASQEVARVGMSTHTPYILGGMTPSEIDRCLELGSVVVKVFPAQVVGPQFLATLKGPLPLAEFFPTGGIGRDAVGKWLAAGAIAVGVGGDLLNLIAGREPNYLEITRRAERLMESVGRAPPPTSLPDKKQNGQEA